MTKREKGEGKEEKTRCDCCDDRVKAEEGDSSAALQTQDNPECPLCSRLWQILISFWCQHHPVDVGHGGWGTGIRSSVPVAPLNGKTKQEINYQYVVDVQSNAATESEHRRLEWF